MPAPRHSLAALALSAAAVPGLLLCLPHIAAARELAADRPDATESPITVEPGRIQIESSLWSYTQDRAEGIRFESWTFGETNLKFGVTSRSDLQLVLTPYVYEREKQAGRVHEAEGFGDLELRFKWNLWGNDAGETAAALFPYVKIPSGTAVSNGEWEGGLILPFSWDLSERCALGLQIQIDRAFDEDEGHYWSFGHSAVLGFALTGRLGCFVEYAGSASDLPYQAFASGGFTFRIGENMQWDIGTLAGLNRHSEDLTLFQGLTLRF
ncbi:MAG TPA: transporter [Verrucomicrobiales bacterium]|nr:transporter [Verrucomicrobiales bacterium]